MAILDADVVVVGAGSVGSMAAWQLAERGLRVIAVDRFTVPGPFSAYAGESRVFRMVYAEGGHYTPLLQRARDLWRELEAVSGTELLTITGVVTVMDHDHPDHAALLRAGRERGLSFEVVAGAEARRRLPEHLIRDGDVALFDPEGGFVRSERAVFSAVWQAQHRGASFLGNRQVRALERDGDRWLVRTDQEEVRAPRVLVATGTGAGPVCDALGTHLAVLPQVLTWFPIADHDLLARGGQQVFIRSSHDAQFYGFPSSDGWTMKVAASIYLDEVASMARPDHLGSRAPGHGAILGEHLPARAGAPARPDGAVRRRIHRRRHRPARVRAGHGWGRRGRRLLRSRIQDGVLARSRRRRPDRRRHDHYGHQFHGPRALPARWRDHRHAPLEC